MTAKEGAGISNIDGIEVDFVLQVVQYCNYDYTKLEAKIPMVDMGLQESRYFWPGGYRKYLHLGRR